MPYDRRKAYNERLRAKGLTTRGRPFSRKTGHTRAGRNSFDAMIPYGPARDMIAEWREMGIPVSFYLQMQGTEKDSPPGIWMIQVGNRELSVEEYLLLFDDNAGDD